MPKNEDLQKNQEGEENKESKEVSFDSLTRERQNEIILDYRNTYDKSMSREKVEELHSMSPEDREAALTELVQEKKDDLVESADKEVADVVEIVTLSDDQAEKLDDAQKEKLGEIEEDAVAAGKDVKEKIEAVSTDETVIENVESAIEGSNEEQRSFASVEELKTFLSDAHNKISVIDSQLKIKDEQKEVNDKNHLLSKAMTAKINSEIDSDIENLNSKKAELQDELDRYKESEVLLKKAEQYEEQKEVNEKNHLLSKAMTAKINSEIDSDIEKVNEKIERSLIESVDEKEVKESKEEEVTVETGEKVEEKPTAEVEASKVENAVEFVEFFKNINLGDFKSQKSIEQLQTRFAAIFTPEFLTKLNIDPSLKQGIVNKYFDSMLSKVEEYMEVKVAQQQKEKKGFKELKKLGRAAWGGALYSTLRGGLTKALQIGSSPALPIKIALGGVVGAGVAGFNHLVGRSWDAVTGKKISKMAKKLSKGGFDSGDMFAELQGDMDLLLDSEARSNELLSAYGEDATDPEMKKLIESTRKIKQGDVENEQGAIQQRQEMIKKLLGEGKIKDFIYDQIDKEFIKLKAEHGGELDEEAKNKLMKQAHLQATRDINVIMGDVVAQEKFTEVDDKGKKFFERGYVGKLLGKAPAETLVQKMWKGFTSGAVAGLIYNDTVAGGIYMTVQRLLGTLRAETLRESKDSTVVKTAKDVIEDINKVTLNVNNLDEASIRSVIQEARARVKLPDMKEIDRAKIESSIRKLENTYIKNGAYAGIKSENAETIKMLAEETAGEREGEISKAAELASEEKQRKSWFTKGKGIIAQFRKLDEKAKAKIVLKSVWEAAKGGAAGALGVELVGMGSAAMAGESFDAGSSLDRVLNRASLGATGVLGLEFANDPPLGQELKDEQPDSKNDQTMDFAKLHSLVDGDVEQSVNQQGEVITSVNIEIGKEGDYNHIDQALRRVVIDNYNLSGTEVDVYDDAKVENIVANLRNDIIAGKAENISFDEKTGALKIDNYDQLGEDLSDRQLHADKVINEKADALAYTDNTSHKIMSEMWTEKIMSQNPDTDSATIKIEDASESQLVKDAEQRVFEDQTKVHFDGLGEDIEYMVGAEESEGTVALGETKFSIENGKVTAIDGVKLSEPMVLDGQFQEKFIVFKIGADYGLDIEELKELGVIEAGNFEVTQGEQKALSLMKPLFEDKNANHLAEFQKNYKINEFIDDAGKLDETTLDFVRYKYQFGEYIDRPALDGLVEDAELLGKQVKDITLMRVDEITKQGIDISESEKGIVFTLPEEDGRPAARIVVNDGVVELPESNNLLTKDGVNTTSSINLSEALGAKGLRGAHSDLVEQEMAQNRLLIESEVSGGKDGLFEIPMEKEYLSVALDQDASILADKKNFVDTMKEYGKAHGMKTVGQKDNFGELYDIFDKNVEGGFENNPPVAGETVRDYLVRVVGTESQESVVEAEQDLDSKFYNPNLADNILEENQELVEIVAADREFLEEMRDDLQELRKDAGETGKDLKESMVKIRDLEDQKSDLMGKLMKNPGDQTLHAQIKEVATELNNARMYEQGGAKIQDGIAQGNIEGLQAKIAIIERGIDDSQDQIQSNLEVYSNNLDKPYSLDYLGEQNQDKILSEMNEALEDVPADRREKFTNDVMEVVREMDKEDIAGKHRPFVKAFHAKAEEMGVDVGGLMKPATNQMLRIVYGNLSGDNLGVYQDAYNKVAELNPNDQIHDAKTIGEFYRLPGETLEPQGEDIIAGVHPDGVVGEKAGEDITAGVVATHELVDDLTKQIKEDNLSEQEYLDIMAAQKGSNLTSSEAEQAKSFYAKVMPDAVVDQSAKSNITAGVEESKETPKAEVPSSGAGNEAVKEKDVEGGVVVPEGEPKPTPEAKEVVDVPQETQPDSTIVLTQGTKLTNEQVEESLDETTAGIFEGYVQESNPDNLPEKGTITIGQQSYDMSNPDDRQTVANINAAQVESMRDSALGKQLYEQELNKRVEEFKAKHPGVDLDAPGAMMDIEMKLDEDGWSAMFGASKQPGGSDFKSPSETTSSADFLKSKDSVEPQEVLKTDSKPTPEVKPEEVAEDILEGAVEDGGTAPEQAFDLGSVNTVAELKDAIANDSDGEIELVEFIFKVNGKDELIINYQGKDNLYTRGEDGFAEFKKDMLEAQGMKEEIDTEEAKIRRAIISHNIESELGDDNVKFDNGQNAYCNNLDALEAKVLGFKNVSPDAKEEIIKLANYLRQDMSDPDSISKANPNISKNLDDYTYVLQWNRGNEGENRITIMAVDQKGETLTVRTSHERMIDELFINPNV